MIWRELKKALTEQAESVSAEVERLEARIERVSTRVDKARDAEDQEAEDLWMTALVERYQDLWSLQAELGRIEMSLNARRELSKSEYIAIQTLEADPQEVEVDDLGALDSAVQSLVRERVVAHGANDDFNACLLGDGEDLDRLFDVSLSATSRVRERTHEIAGLLGLDDSSRPVRLLWAKSVEKAARLKAQLLKSFVEKGREGIADAYVHAHREHQQHLAKVEVLRGERTVQEWRLNLESKGETVTPEMVTQKQVTEFRERKPDLVRLMRQSFRALNEYEQKAPPPQASNAAAMSSASAGLAGHRRERRPGTLRSRGSRRGGSRSSSSSDDPGESEPGLARNSDHIRRRRWWLR